jgi:hypothetical protein
MAKLRPVRFLIYFTTIAYAIVVLIVGPETDASKVAPGLLTSVYAGAFVGIAQSLAALVGLVVDCFSQARRWLIKPIFLILSASFLYESVLKVIAGSGPFDWIPFLVYAALCSVVYLSEG